MYIGFKLQNGVILGDDHGCGCCGGDTTLTTKQLAQAIDELEQLLFKAKDILARVKTAEANHTE